MTFRIYAFIEKKKTKNSSKTLICCLSSEFIAIGNMYLSHRSWWLDKIISETTKRSNVSHAIFFLSFFLHIYLFFQYESTSTQQIMHANVTSFSSRERYKYLVSMMLTGFVYKYKNIRQNKHLFFLWPRIANLLSLKSASLYSTKRTKEKPNTLNEHKMTQRSDKFNQFFGENFFRTVVSF